MKLIISKTKEPFLKDLFSVAFYTGMRLGELTNMKGDWIDDYSQSITIKCDESFLTKAKKERIIPINSNIQSILLNAVKTKDYIFRNGKGIKLNNDYVSKKFKASVREVGLNEAIHFHTLRHSFASQLVQKGVSLYVVKELLGHEDLTTTQIYSHLQNENLQAAVCHLG